MDENKKFAQEELAKILERMQNNNQTKEDEQLVVETVAYNTKHSCDPYEREIKGECYPSKSTIVLDIIKGVGVVVMCAGIVIAMAKLGQMETAGDIQKEINRRVTVQNIIGGSYSEEYVYSEDFRNYMNACGDKLLIQEFKEAKEEMGMVDDPLLNPSTKDVIKYMEQEYLEENKGMVR